MLELNPDYIHSKTDLDFGALHAIACYNFPNMVPLLLEKVRSLLCCGKPPSSTRVYICM